MWHSWIQIPTVELLYNMKCSKMVTGTQTAFHEILTGLDLSSSAPNWGACFKVEYMSSSHKFILCVSIDIYMPGALQSSI